MRPLTWKVLPHGHPFILVDRVVAVIPGVRASGLKLVTANEELPGGWRSQDLAFPGVLLVEGLAQLAGIAWLGGETGAGGWLAAISEARFVRDVVPGDIVEMEAVVSRVMGTMARVEGVARVEQIEVARAQLTLVREQG